MYPVVERFALKTESREYYITGGWHLHYISYLNTLQVFAYTIPLFKWEEVKQLAEMHSSAQLIEIWNLLGPNSSH